MGKARQGPNDVIAAIATPPGRGGVGIVRVSGPDLAAFSRAITGGVPAPRLATRTYFIDGAGQPIDDGIALYFPSPASYTGEDVLELQGHGGPVVMQMLLKRCLQLGARVAEPGEFTRRAFLNDKLDLAQAESVADIIEAATETAARCAMRSLRGDFSVAVAELMDQLVELRMLVEATLDFPEEEIDNLDRCDVGARLERLRLALGQALERGRQGSVLRSGLQVVLAGRPNVGKSSLLNRLAGEDLAIVTPIPGTTRDTIRQVIEIKGLPLNIIDTAGLRETSDEVEKMGIARTWEALAQADVLMLIVEAETGLTAEDDALLARLPDGPRLLVVHNKIDLSGHLPGQFGAEAEQHHFHLSAKTGAGLEGLRQALLDIAGWQSGGEGVFLARERHMGALAAAKGHLAQASTNMGQAELLAEELRLAHSSLALVSGEFTPDDLLGEIFSRFCVGK
jgi:tRNA modification GTPase